MEEFKKMYKLRNKKLKEARGITLIALVITIIVLLILAGVTISVLTGENGILKETNEAVIENAHGEVKELMYLEYENYIIEKSQGKSQKDLIGYFKDKKIIEETEGKYKINVENLLNKKTSNRERNKWKRCIHVRRNSRNRKLGKNSINKSSKSCRNRGNFNREKI